GDALAAKMAFVSGVQNRAAHWKQPAHIRAGEDAVHRFADQSFEALLDAEHLVAHTIGGLHNGANHGVETRRVASACQHSNTPSLLDRHCCLLQICTSLYVVRDRRGGSTCMPSRKPRCLAPEPRTSKLASLYTSSG